MNVINDLILNTMVHKTLGDALELFCIVCKMQLFNDGNKITATLITNMFMMQNGLGILSIPVDKKLDFYDALTHYYENEDNKDSLKEFLSGSCLTGITQRPEDM